MRLQKIIQKTGVVITDGSMGTYLEKLGYRGKTPELAVIEQPDLIKKIHTEYIESGAEVILTDTFGANRIQIAKKGLAEELFHINSNAVKVALNAKGEKDVAIAGDIGPIGELLEPYGNLTHKEAGDTFLQQAEILTKSGVDFILLETFQDIEEMKVAFYSIKEKIDVFILPSITFTSGDSPKTLMGQGLEEIVKFAEREGIDVLGINCGVSSREMIKIVKQLRGLTDITLWAKPNAGQPHLLNGKVIYPEGIDEFANNCIEMVRGGVKFIGGCCGTNPDYIRALRDRLNENS
ncbi:MAG: homocysteine S-methyltransferase family protein [Candidatus Ratteibacteria bacterium]|nr:homocysteine S-methyltransferase family protein [Candidatus Ratteibacteria bacterium]